MITTPWGPVPEAIRCRCGEGQEQHAPCPMPATQEDGYCDPCREQGHPGIWEAVGRLDRGELR